MKLRAITAVVVASLSLYSCSDKDYNSSIAEDENIQEETFEEGNRIVVSVVDTVWTGVLETENLSEGGNKGYQDGKYSVLSGGNVTIAGCTVSTAIVGGQRWTTMPYSGRKLGDRLEVEENDEFFYYGRDDVMSIGEVMGVNKQGVPAGLREKSNWRVPSYEDVTKLSNNIKCNSRGEKYKKLFAMFNSDLTGAFYYAGGSSQAVYFYPEYSIFWLSNTNKEAGKTYENNFVQMFNDQCWSTGPYQHGPYGYAPLRFVQDIEPIENVK